MAVMSNRVARAPKKRRRAGKAPHTIRHTAAIAIALLPATAAPTSAPALAAQEPERDPQSYRVTAHLRDADTDGPLMGALIEISDQPGQYVTAMNGRVSFEIPAGDYTFTARKGGYATLHGAFHVVYDGNLTLTVAMRKMGDVDTSAPERLLVRVAESGSGRPIEGAVVLLPGGRSRLTDGRGLVEFADVGGPATEVGVRMLGYEPRTALIALREGRTTVAEVALAIDAVVLSPIEVEVRSPFLERHGVYWRIDRGMAKEVLTREELIERAEPRLANAFRNIIPGVRVDYRGHLTVLVNHLNCPLTVYLDGRRMKLDVRRLNIDDITPEMLELAEVYEEGRTPGRFPGACGAVLLWSRHRAGREGGRSRRGRGV